MLDTYEIGTGTVLADRYAVERKLGAGGMATVYLAEDQVLGRRVAVKRLRGEGDAADLERFRREARLGATLSHANVVTVFDTVAGDDGVLIVMEYVEGETLADALAGAPLGDERAIEVLSAVAAALDHAHANGIVHRDVKPANVLLGDDGTIKLADLGIATAIAATRITTTHDIVGTLAYIAPERLDSDFAGRPRGRRLRPCRARLRDPHGRAPYPRLDPSRGRPQSGERAAARPARRLAAGASGGRSRAQGRHGPRSGEASR